MKKEVGGKTFEIRPLTRGEIKGLRKKGYNLSKLNADDADECVDEVIEIVLGERTAEIDDMPNMCAVDLFGAIVDETYGGGETEKNSLSSGDGGAKE